MQDPNIENTVPTRPDQTGEETVPTMVQFNSVEPNNSLEGTQPVHASDPKTKSPRRWPWIMLGFFLILVFGAFGTWQGYHNAEQIRSDKFQEQRVANATKHFMAGLVAQENKQYEIARSQYEYVIQMDPSFPGVQDKLREVMIESAIVNTPTPVPTEVIPTLTPTPDTRPQEEIFNQARQQYANKEWDGLFETIYALRGIDPTYQAVQIDGMLYFAFRFRGIDKIIHSANLEGGLYDLALSERFGPLDVDALGYRNWARMYLSGASFWEIDWEKVMLYFEEIYPYFPNMRDSSGLTAIERYRIAARSQGDRLSDSGDYCGAMEFYEKSLQAVADDAVVQKATEVFNLCYPPTDVPTVTPIPTVTSTVTPTIDIPVVTTEPAPEPTVEEPEPVPTEETPIPAPTE